MNSRNSRLIISVFTTLLCVLVTSATGFIPVRNFNRAYYTGGPQNWSAVQDSAGKVYVANRDGMMVYDGLRWSTYTLPNYTTVRSLLYDAPQSRIYAGGSEEFGFFSPDSVSGELRYTSLSGMLSDSREKFSEIWNILDSGDNIWFQSDFQMFRYDGTSLSVYRAPGRISRSAIVGNRIYVALEDGRVLYFVDRKFNFLPGTGLLAGRKISALLPSPAAGEFMAVTSTDGMFIYDKGTFHPFESDISQFLKDNQVFCATSREGDYVFGTVGRGAVVKNFADGRTRYINKEGGMQNNTVLGIAFDKAGNIWLCLDNGLDYAVYNSPLANLIGAADEVGAGYVSLLMGDRIYFGTNQGLYSAAWPFSASPHPLHVTRELRGQIWSLTEAGGDLLVSGDAGLFTGRAGAFSQVGNTGGVHKVLPVPGSGSLALASTYTRFHLLRRGAGGWSDLGPVAGYDDIGGNFLFGPDGYVWLPHFRKGIYRLRLDTLNRRFTEVRLFNSDLGLPHNHNNAVEIYEGRPVFSTCAGFYTPDIRTGRAVRDSALDAILPARPGSKLLSLPDGKVLLVDRGLKIASRRADGRYSFDSGACAAPADMLIPGYENINYISPHEMIVSNQEGFWSIDLARENHTEWTPQPFVSRVFASNDSLVYLAPLSGRGDAEMTVPYSLNSLKFEFAFPDFTTPHAAEFSSWLEDYEAEWTPYSRQATREYTQLPEGRYTLHIRVRDAETDRTAETRFVFTVSPPWYRSTTANIVYFLLIITALIALHKGLQHWVERAKRKIEAKKEVEMEQLRRQAEQEALRQNFEIATLKSEQLEQDVRHKSSELSNTTMNLIRKNEILTHIDEKITKIQDSLGAEHDDESIRKQLKRLKASIRENISHDDDWKTFTENFDIVYADYTKRLMERHPNLSPADKRLCCYIKMGLSSKEIAPLINISFKSVEMARYRLRKKMELPSEVSLSDYLGAL